MFSKDGSKLKKKLKSKETKRSSKKLLRKNCNLLVLHTKRKLNHWDKDVVKQREIKIFKIEISISCRKILRKYLWEVFVHLILKRWIFWIRQSSSLHSRKWRLNFKNKLMEHLTKLVLQEVKWASHYQITEEDNILRHHEVK